MQLTNEELRFDYNYIYNLHLNPSLHALSRYPFFAASCTKPLVMIPYSELQTVYPVSKLRWIPAVSLFTAKHKGRIFLGDFRASYLNIILWRRKWGWNSAPRNIFLLLRIIYFPLLILSRVSSKSILRPFIFIVEYVWQVQAVNRDRLSWIGVNSVHRNWIIYRELTVWRSLMTKANFLPWTCLWHWKVKNPNRTKHTDSGETLFIKIYILKCHWPLLFIMLFGTIAWNSNLWCFYHFKTFSWTYCTLHHNKPSGVCSFQSP
jgi:hypothetical protein